MATVYSHSPDYIVRNVAGNETTYMIVKDQLGSILQLVDQNGNVTQDIEYDEFGNMTLNSNPEFQPLGFASGLYDPDTKLTRFGTRDYDPAIGRWLQRDPIKFQGGDTNLYAYVGNDPINNIDPSGLSNQILEPINDPWAGGGGAPSMCPPGPGYLVPTLPLIPVVTNPPKQDPSSGNKDDYCTTARDEYIKNFCIPMRDSGDGSQGKCYANAYAMWARCKVTGVFK